MGEKVDDDSVKIRKEQLVYFKTACLSAAFLVLGLCIAIIGPALPTLAYNLGKDQEDVSFIFTARGGGYLCGSILSALLFKKLNPYLLIFICLLGVGFGNMFTPFVPMVWLLSVMMMATGCAMGVLDTGGNVLCLLLWGRDSEPWMQTLHFAFALGATVSPFIAQPFINEAALEKESISYVGNATSPAPVTKYETSTPFSTTESVPSWFPQVAWAFMITAVLTLFVSISFLFLSCSKTTKKARSVQQDTIKQEGRKFRLQVLALLFTFYFLYVGTEVSFGLFIYTFAIECEKKYTKDEGAALTSVFWGLFAAGRFAAIFLSHFINPRTMLVMDMLGTLISTVAMSLFPFYAFSADWILWASVGLYGWSMASLFPSGISWAERYITVTGKAASVLVVGAALGEMALPFLMGHLVIGKPLNLMYFCLASTILSIVNFSILHIIASSRGSRHKLVNGGALEGTDSGEEKGPEEYALLTTADSSMTGMPKITSSSEEC